MQIISYSVPETIRTGKIIAKNLKSTDIICLFGELGTGKTTLVKGIAWGLGIKREKVISPTFVLIREHHQGRLPLYHFDLYRIKSTAGILELGCEEYFYDAGVTVIEWADRLNYLLPKEFLKIELSIQKNAQRLLKFIAKGKRYEALLRKIHEDIRH